MVCSCHSETARIESFFISPDYAYVDNTMFAYYVGWHLPDANTSGYGAIIEYTFYEPY